MKQLKLLAVLMLISVIAGCAVGHLKINDNGDKRLSPCFPLPNCVSSDSFMFYNSTDPQLGQMNQKKAGR